MKQEDGEESVSISMIIKSKFYRVFQKMKLAPLKTYEVAEIICNCIIVNLKSVTVSTERISKCRLCGTFSHGRSSWSLIDATRARRKHQLPVDRGKESLNITMIEVTEKHNSILKNWFCWNLRKDQSSKTRNLYFNFGNFFSGKTDLSTIQNFEKLNLNFFYFR